MSDAWGEPGVPDSWVYRIIPCRRSDARWWNWIFWALFGNDEDGIFWPEPYHWGGFRPYTGQHTLWNFLRWWVRNPFHNLFWHTLRWPWPQHESNALVLWDSVGGWWYRRPHVNWVNGEGANENGFQIELLPLYCSWRWYPIEGYAGWKLDFGFALRRSAKPGEV